MTTDTTSVIVHENLIYFSSVSENTKKFVDKLGVASSRIPLRRGEKGIIATNPFVLVIPTYGGDIVDGKVTGAVPKQVIKFLNEERNRSLLRGVIAGGNTNFGEAYGIAGDIIAAKCLVPSLYRFELMGTKEDVETVKEGLEEFWKTH